MTFMQTCAIYWPTGDSTRQQYGPFDIKLVDTEVNETINVTVRQFQFTKSGGVRNNSFCRVLNINTQHLKLRDRCTTINSSWGNA